MNKTIDIYTDGSNVRNGKPDSYGGYGFVILYDDMHIDGGGSMPKNEKNPVTNNVVEILGVITSLEYILENKLFLSDTINIFSDSQYVVKIANKEWKMSNKNFNLWTRYFKTLKLVNKKGIDVNVNWVRGHDGNEWNEHADQLAKYYYRLAKDM